MTYSAFFKYNFKIKKYSSLRINITSKVQDMAVGKDNVIINIEIDVEVKEILKEMSKKLDISVSSLTSILIDISLKELKFFKMSGIQYLALGVKKLLENGPLHIKMKGHSKNSSQNTDFISVTIKKETKKRLEQFADDFEIPFKKLVRNCIYTTLDDYGALTNKGLMRIAYRFRKLLESDREFEELQKSKKQLSS